MSTLPKVGDIVDGKYRIDCELGRGGMAVVLGATQLLTRRDVALKWLLPQIARNQTVVERFLREAQAAARIQHPSVVSVLDVGRWMDDGYYLVMERIVGESLRVRLDRERTLPVADAMAIAGALLGALHAAHAAGVVHRDLKPENVLLRLDERGRLRGTKLLDFGISRLSEKESLTLTGQYVGTAYYLAPEQAGGGSAGGPQIDVYQLGVVLYEMLAGRRPYDAPSYGEIIVALLTTSPPPLGALRPDLPFGLVSAVERAMARDPAIRTPSAMAMARELAPFGARFDEDLERALLEERATAAPASAVGTPTAPSPVASTLAYAETAFGSVPGALASSPDRTAPSAALASAVTTGPMAPAPSAERDEGTLSLPTSRAGPIALAVIGLGAVGGAAALAFVAWNRMTDPGPPTTMTLGSGPQTVAAPPESILVDAALLAIDAGSDAGEDAGDDAAAPDAGASEDRGHREHHAHPHISADEF